VFGVSFEHRTPNNLLFTQSNQNQCRADDDMKNIVGCLPLKIAFGKPIHKTRNGLIKVNQAKPNVESANQFLIFAQDKSQSNPAEDDVKDIVAGGVAHQARGQNKSKYSGYNQNRSED
jgi:hypothetical protein